MVINKESPGSTADDKYLVVDRFTVPGLGIVHLGGKTPFHGLLLQHVLRVACGPETGFHRLLERSLA